MIQYIYVSGKKLDIYERNYYKMKVKSPEMQEAVHTHTHTDILAKISYIHF